MKDKETLPEQCPLCGEDNYLDTLLLRVRVRLFECGLYRDGRDGSYNFFYLTGEDQASTASTHFRRSLEKKGLAWASQPHPYTLW